MEERGINKYLLLLVLLIISVYTVLFFRFTNHNDLSKNFPDLNSIELYIESSPKYVYTFIDQFNSVYDKGIYAYVDNSKKILIQNSLKVKSVDQLDVYYQILSNPNINNLFQSISRLTDESKLTKEINVKKEQLFELLDKMVDLLSQYLLDEQINKNIGLDILESIVLDHDVNINYKNLFKINIVVENNYSNKSNLKNQFLDIFKYLKNFQSDNIKIKYVNFYNYYAYKLFENYKQEMELSIIPEYLDYVVSYVDSLNSHSSLLSNDFIANNNISVNSLDDYLTDNTLKGEKYKKIKKISYALSKYDKNNKWLPFQGVRDLYNSMVDIEMNLNKYKVYNNILGDIQIDNILHNLSIISNYLNENKHDYYINYLINNYNDEAYNFVEMIANTEPINLDFIDPYIYRKYYNEYQDKYVLFVDCNNSDDCKNYLVREFGANSSLYLVKKLKYLNLSLYIFISILCGFYFFKRIKLK